jgi:hypothetical protein
MSRLIDLTGQRFGRLLILGRVLCGSACVSVATSVLSRRKRLKDGWSIERAFNATEAIK